MTANILNTNGSTVYGTVAELDAWDTIQYSADEPLLRVDIVVEDGGELDLSDELDTGIDSDEDGMTEARGAAVETSAFGNTITTGSGDDLLGGLLRRRHAARRSR